VAQDEFTRPCLIVVEGPGDAEFFPHLIRCRGLPAKFHVRCPWDADGVSGGGNTRFRQALDAFGVIPGFDDLEAIIVATDADDDPTVAFANAQEQIRRTARGLVAPPAPLVEGSGRPLVSVLVVPWVDEPGNLETLCAVAAAAAFPRAAHCADQFEACTGVAAWPVAKRSKVRLRSILSSAYQRNPDLSLARLWRTDPGLVPLGHECFDRIANYLGTFGNSVGD
jgi:hypothetical protein